MRKYYTKACNFFYGKLATDLIKKKRALPLCGKNNIAFNLVEIFTRHPKGTKKEIISLKDVKSLNKEKKKIIEKDLKNIALKRKNFLNNVNFSTPSIMGILNLTPDSFSDGGKFNKKNKSIKQIKHLIKHGANIIDVGGESTRPYSNSIKSVKEWQRIKYVVRNFKKKFRSTCLSIDTRKSDIMRKALNYKADLINDVSGFAYDINSLKTIKKFKTPKVIHHMQGTTKTMQINPRYKDVLLDIYDFFEKKINKMDNKKIILDPGIGFGKTLKHNLTLLSNISLFHSLGYPILVGTSRKRFINQLSNIYDSKERIGGTLASVIYLLSQGIQIFRVHNVHEVKQGIIVFNKLLHEK